jgi:hypothetical protein
MGKKPVSEAKLEQIKGGLHGSFIHYQFLMELNSKLNLIQGYPNRNLQHRLPFAKC